MCIVSKKISAFRLCVFMGFDVGLLLLVVSVLVHFFVSLLLLLSIIVAVLFTYLHWWIFFLAVSFIEKIFSLPTRTNFADCFDSEVLLLECDFYGKNTKDWKNGFKLVKHVWCVCVYVAQIYFFSFVKY